MKKAFTLVELIIVVGIICILAAILIASFGGGTESARNALCLTNMRNLAAACQTYGMTHRHYPVAGSFEKIGLDESEGISNVKRKYYEIRGWISWNSQNAYASAPQSHVASYDWFTSCYNQDREVREYALTNGALWKYVSGNRNIFVCPCHKRACDFSRQPIWSYVMNSYFHWDKTKGAHAMDEGCWGIEYGKLSRADRRLLFAEIPFTNWISDPPKDTDTSSGTATDCTLQYAAADGGEYIGFNHKSGTKLKFAHVVFADGHVDKIVLPESGLDVSKARDLTEWLCKGKDISYDGTDYKELKN